MGRVDLGGGGTIAYIMANYGMQVLDAGVPVLSMHAPWEIISKVDLYEAYKGYIAFFNFLRLTISSKEKNEPLVSPHQEHSISIANFISSKSFSDISSSTCSLISKSSLIAI